RGGGGQKLEEGKEKKAGQAPRGNSGVTQGKGKKKKKRKKKTPPLRFGRISRYPRGNCRISHRGPRRERSRLHCKGNRHCRSRAGHERNRARGRRLARESVSRALRRNEAGV